MKKQRKTKKLSEKQLKLIIKSSLVFVLVLLIGTFFVYSYALYESNATLNANIDKAIYLLKDEKLSFNIDSDGIVPSTTPYTYKFSVQNYEDSKEGDFNLDYYIKVKTTTNLPITIELYRNEEYSTSATNIIPSFELTQDTDGAWYREYDDTPTYQFNYNTKRKDVYTLVVKYPEIYRSYEQYAGVPENITIGIYSTQRNN